MNGPVDVLNTLRKFERTFTVAGLDEEAADIASVFSVVAELIDADMAFDKANNMAGRVDWDAYYAAKSRRAAAIAQVGHTP